MAKTNIKEIRIKNMVRNLPSELSEQGTLSKVHNARYNKNNIIENVCSFATKERITKPNGFNIVYIHSDRYIAYDTENNLHHIDIELGSIVSKSIIKHKVDTVATINSFGKVLYITTLTSQLHFIFTNNSYSELQINNMLPLDNVEINCSYKTASNHDGHDRCIVFGYSSISKKIDEYTLKLEEVRAADYTPGVFYLMFAYRLFDGSIIKPSKAYMINTSDQLGYNGGYFYRDNNMTLTDGQTYTYAYSFPVSGAKVSLNISFDPNILTNDLIRSIVVYATHPEQEYDYSSSHEIFEASPQQPEQYISKVQVNYFRYKKAIGFADKPFYEIDDLLLSSAVDNMLTKELTWGDHFDNIEHGIVFEPTFTVHNTIHRGMLEYNSRLHSFNHTTTLYNGSNILYNRATYSGDAKVALPAGYTLHIETTLRINDRILTVKCDDINHYYEFIAIRPEGNYSYIAIDNFVSYPDYRAEKLTVYLSKGGFRKEIASLPLLSSTANNFAYYIEDKGNTIASQRIILLSDIESFTPDSASFKECEPITYKDKVMVSMINNPFAFEPRHTYNIEGEECEIFALATAAAGLTEDTYGTHPLLVFTSKGLFTLEQGTSDILYSNVVTLDNSDRYRVRDTAALSSMIFFISADEVMAISNRAPTSVSTIINPSNNTPRERAEFKRYMATAKPYTLIWYDEVMIYNDLFNYAYIYSIESNCWSTRDLTATHVTNSVMLSGGDLISLLYKEDTNKPLALSLKTNSMSFSDMGLKKIEYIEPLLSATSNTLITTTLWGSNNQTEWYNIGSSKQGLKIGRCGSSWRYFILEVVVDRCRSTGSGIHIWGLAVKVTTRYHHVVD